MSGFFQNNKTAIHIASEVIVFGIAMFVIYRKTNTLSDEIKDLETRVMDLENIVIEQKKIINQIMSTSKNYSMYSQTHPVVHIQSSQPTHGQTHPVVHIQSSQPTYSQNNSNQSQPTYNQNISNQSQPTSQTLATIVEIEEDELDKSLEEELKELKN